MMAAAAGAAAVAASAVLQGKTSWLMSESLRRLVHARLAHTRVKTQCVACCEQLREVRRQVRPWPSMSQQQGDN